MFLTTNKGYIHSYKHFVICGVVFQHLVWQNNDKKSHALGFLFIFGNLLATALKRL